MRRWAPPSILSVYLEGSVTTTSSKKKKKKENKTGVGKDGTCLCLAKVQL